MPLDLGASQSEDCWSLNIWAPADTEPGDGKPVMVWLHGGAYILGSGSQPLYNGRRLAASGDVVVVTVNYRLRRLASWTCRRSTRHGDGSTRISACVTCWPCCAG